MSWGHDEYLYHVVKDYLPEEGLAMIRYHSFYAAHREGAYTHLMNDDDQRRMEWVRKFNPYDLYSKGHEPPDVDGPAALLRRPDRRVFPGQVGLVTSWVKRDERFGRLVHRLSLHLANVLTSPSRARAARRQFRARTDRARHRHRRIAQGYGAVQPVELLPIILEILPLAGGFERLHRWNEPASLAEDHHISRFAVALGPERQPRLA